MRKGLGMWVMSKLVMFIFLFSLVAALGAYYMIYQDKVIDDTAKKVTQSIAETITDALSYRKTTRTIWLDSNIWIRDTSRTYTIFLQHVVDADYHRVAVFLAWNDHEEKPESFAAASAVNMIQKGFGEDSVYAIGTVCFYEIDSEGDINEIGDELLIRPSSPDQDSRSDYLLVYKSGDKLCLASKNVRADLKEALDALKTECDTEC